MTILIVILIALAVGWWLTSVEFSAGFTGILTSGFLGEKSLRVVVVLFTSLGAIFFAENLANSISIEAQLTTPVSSVVVVLAAFMATLITYRIGKMSSICYAAIGAIMGWELFSSSSFGKLHIGEYLLSWLVAPLICFSLAALTYSLYRRLVVKKRVHLISLMQYLRVATIISSILLALAIGINNGALLIALNSTINPTYSLMVGNMALEAMMPTLIISLIILFVVLQLGVSSRSFDRYSESSELSVESVLIASFSTAAVLLLFSSNSLCSLLFLKASPLSIVQLIFAAQLGIIFVKDRKINAKPALFPFISIVATPTIAFVIAYSSLKIIDIGAINSAMSVIDISSRTLNITIPLILVGVILVLVSGVVYIMRLNRIKTRVERSAIEQQRSLFESQIALSELEIKSVLLENQNLSQKLELRRNELINIALNISEQKDFLKTIYQELKSAGSISNNEERVRKIAEVESMLLQKMDFSQEMNSFYLQVEQLHKDFNLRLMEKYPNLTEQERRLTILLRLGFSSKYIASLMNILPKSVEINRYRLRAKFGLMQEQRLTTFIKSI